MALYDIKNLSAAQGGLIFIQTWLTAPTIIIWH